MSNASPRPLHSSTGGKSPLLTAPTTVATPRLMNSFAVFHSFMAPKGMTPRQLAETLHRRCYALAENDADRWIASQPFESVFFLLCLEAICTNSRECWAIVCLLIEIYDESFATILAHAKVFAENYPDRAAPGGPITFGVASQLLMYWPAVQKKLGSRTTIGDKRVEEGMTWSALSRLFVRAYPIDTSVECGDRTLFRYACFFLNEWFYHLKAQPNDQLVAAGVVPFAKLWSIEKTPTPFSKLLEFVPPMRSSIPVSTNYMFLYDVVDLKNTVLLPLGTDGDGCNPGTPAAHARILMDTPAYRLAAVAALVSRGAPVLMPSCLHPVFATWSSVGSVSPVLRGSLEEAPKTGDKPAAPKRSRVRRVAPSAQNAEGEVRPPPAKRQRRPRPAQVAPPPQQPEVPAPDVLNEESNPPFAFGDSQAAHQAFEESMGMGRIDDYPDDI